MPSTSVFGQVLDAVKAQIDGLTMTGLSTTVIQEYPTRKDRTLPFVSIAPGPGGVQVQDATNAREDIIYPVAVTIFAQATATTLDARLLWVQQIRRALHNLQLSGITGGTFVNCKFAPLNTQSYQALQESQAMVATGICRVTVREGRT